MNDSRLGIKVQGTLEVGLRLFIHLPLIMRDSPVESGFSHIRIKVQGGAVIFNRFRKRVRSRMSQGAVVKNLRLDPFRILVSGSGGRPARRAQANTKGFERLLSAIETISTHAVIVVRPKSTRLQADGLLEF